jgi:hypothetical protein
VTNAQVYCGAEMITVVKGFIAQAQEERKFMMNDCELVKN